MKHKKQQSERDKHRAEAKRLKREQQVKGMSRKSLMFLGVDFFALSNLGSRIAPLYKFRRCNICGEYVREDIAVHEASCKGNPNGKKTNLFKAIRMALSQSGAI